jgi:trehalose 6-phosphate synthase
VRAMSRLVVVSNRVSMPGQNRVSKGGLAVGLSQALAQRGGVWFGWNGKRAARALSKPERTVADNVVYTTQPLTELEYQHYYLGYSNRVLWPVFHDRPDLLHEEPGYRECYEAVNHRFAAQLQKLLREDDLVWIHDYHLIPLAKYLRALGVDNRIGFFLHIPFPAVSMLAHIEGVDELLSDLLSYDLIGLQTAADVDALHAACSRLPGVQAQGGRFLSAQSRHTQIDAFPIGIDVDHIRELLNQRHMRRRVKTIRSRLSGGKLIVGVDRLDYSKGIPERLRGYARYLAKYPPQQEVALLQIAQPSRDTIPEYHAVRVETQRLVESIHERVTRFSRGDLGLYSRGLPRDTVLLLLRASDVGLVTPLRDGMNLVAKEFVAAQDQHDPGVLVLGEGAGAACELDAALKVDPRDPDSIAEAIDTALRMPLVQRRERWHALFNTVCSNDINAWADAILERLATTPNWQKKRPAGSAELPAGESVQEQIFFPLLSATAGFRAR